MSASGRLADLIWDKGACKWRQPGPNEVAEAILNEGYREPARIITTVEELDALAENTVIRDAEHATMQFIDCKWWSVANSLPWPADAVDLPATVLHEPEAKA